MDKRRKINEWASVGMDALIVGNGEYPFHEEVRQLVHQAPFVACCDGAADTYFAHEKRIPQLVIGDGDSLSEEGKKRFADVWVKVSEQETNDQTKAVRWMHAHGYRRITIVAATGRREDHTLGNISLLVDYMQMGLLVCMFTDYGCFIPASGETTFASFPGQQVSVFSFGATAIQSEGLVYPLHDLTNWWQGTLNEAQTNQFTIRCTGFYLVYRAFA